MDFNLNNDETDQMRLIDYMIGFPVNVGLEDFLHQRNNPNILSVEKEYLGGLISSMEMYKEFCTEEGDGRHKNVSGLIEKFRKEML